MPAIRPERLQRQADHLKDLVDTPATLRWHVVDLLEFYADRTKRHAMTERIADATVRFRVPPPVMQALRASLMDSTRGDPAAALAIAEELWSVEVQEARLLGVGLLTHAPYDEVFEILLSWTKDSQDRPIQDALAELVYQRTIARGDETLRDHAERWLRSRSMPLQDLAVLTLKAASSDGEHDRIHLVFDVLLRAGFRRRLITSRIYRELLVFLIEKSPSETAGYLLSGLQRGRRETKRMVRAMLSHFPAPQRSRLERELD